MTLKPGPVRMHLGKFLELHVCGINLVLANRVSPLTGTDHFEDSLPIRASRMLLLTEQVSKWAKIFATPE